MADCPELRKLHWRCVVIDEAHRLKNKNCKLLEGLKLMNLVSLFLFRVEPPACVFGNVTRLMCVCLLCPTGTQGPTDRNSSPELGGGVVQLVKFPGASAVSIRKHLPGRIRRPQNG